MFVIVTHVEGGCSFQLQIFSTYIIVFDSKMSWISNESILPFTHEIVLVKIAATQIEKLSSLHQAVALTG